MINTTRPTTRTIALLVVGSILGSLVAVPGSASAAEAPAALEFQLQPGGGPSNVAWTQQPVVRIVDANGVTVTSSHLAVTLKTSAATNGLLICNANPVIAVNGIAAFSACFVNAPGSGDLLVATAFGLPAATSDAFTVTEPDPDPPLRIAFDYEGLSEPFTATAEGPIWYPVRVQVIDPTSGADVVAGPGSTIPVTLSMALNPPDATVSCPGGNTVNAVAGIATFTGCSISKPGLRLSLVATTPGSTEAYAIPTDVWPAGMPRGPLLQFDASSMTTSAYAPIWGSPIDLNVALVPLPGGGSMAGRVVHIQASDNPYDPDSWRTFGDVTTDESGRGALRGYTPVRNHYYRVLFDGSADLGPAVSLGWRIVVRQKTLLRPDNAGGVRSIPRGTTVAFRTIVRPARSDLPGATVTWVVLRFWRGQFTRFIDTVTPDASGVTSLAFTFGPGSWRVRSRAEPTKTNANSFWTRDTRFEVR